MGDIDQDFIQRFLNFDDILSLPSVAHANDPEEVIISTLDQDISVTSNETVNQDDIIDLTYNKDPTELFNQLDQLPLPSEEFKPNSQTEKESNNLNTFFNILEQTIAPALTQYANFEREPEFLHSDDLMKTREITKSTTFPEMPIAPEIEGLPNGATFIISNGSYVGGITITNSITIVANGNVQLRSPEDCLTCNAVDLVIQNVEFINTGNNVYSSVIITGGNVTFVNCRFMGSQSTTVFVRNDAIANFYGCTFSNGREGNFVVMNQAMVLCQKCNFSTAQKKCSITLQDKSSSRFNECNISRNQSDCVFITGSASALFQNCKISTNVGYCFEIDSNSPTVILKGNEIKDSTSRNGIYVHGNATPTIVSNQITNNREGSLLIDENAKVFSTGNQYTEARKDNPITAVTLKSGQFISENDSIIGAISASPTAEEQAKRWIGLAISAHGTAICSKLNVSKFMIGLSDEGSLELKNAKFEQIGQICIYAFPNSSLNVEDSSFKHEGNQNCMVNISGEVKGKIKNTYFYGKSEVIGIISKNVVSPFLIENCQFLGSQHCGIHIYGASSVIIRGCSFAKDASFYPTYCAKLVAAGADNSKPIFEECQFANAKQQALQIDQGTHPLFKGCTITTGEVPPTCKYGFGAVITQAMADFVNCIFSGNKNFAVYICKKSQVTLTKCKITANVQLGLVVRDSGTEATLTECEITAHTGSGGCSVQAEASATFNNCKFTRNLYQHLEVSNDAKCSVDHCDFSNSGSDKAINISSKAIVNISNCSIHDESVAGILVCGGANLVLQNSNLTKCGDSAVYIKDSTTKVLLKQNQIMDNITDGVKVLDGDVTFDGNTIVRQAGSGILFKQSVTQNILPNNVIQDNQVKDIMVTQLEGAR